MRPDCEITEAESGADALKMFNEADSFDLIFVDMDLGDMEGTTHFLHPADQHFSCRSLIIDHCDLGKTGAKRARGGAGEDRGQGSWKRF